MPVSVADVPVEKICEEWVVEDGWWNERPLRRRYFELVLEEGHNTVIFKDLVEGRWYAQRC